MKIQNGTADYRPKSICCNKFYPHTKCNRSAKRIQSNISRSESSFAKYHFKKRAQIQNTRNKGNSGRRRSARSEENIAAVRELLEQDPHVSSRRNPIAVSQPTFNRIKRLDLRWHPYRMHVRQELLQNDWPRRLRFSEWFNQRCQNEKFLDRFFIGDEAAFEMNGQANTHNVREYAPRGNPPAFNFDRSRERAKLTVWAGVCGNGLILGPYFFDANVDGLSYLRMLNDFVFPQLANHFNNQYWEGMFRGLWWAQDGASAHRLLGVRYRLNEAFMNRVVGLGHNVEWPPRSPDLTPCDFFMWGYLKDKVFSTPPEKIQQLRQKIIDEFNTLRQRPEMIQRALRDMHRRTLLCVETADMSHIACSHSFVITCKHGKLKETVLSKCFSSTRD